MSADLANPGAAPGAATSDPDLVALVAAWPALPDHIRAAIRALVGTVAGPS